MEHGARTGLDVDSSIARHALKVEEVVLGDLVVLGFHDFSFHGLSVLAGRSDRDRSDQTADEPSPIRIPVDLLPAPSGSLRANRPAWDVPLNREEARREQARGQPRLAITERDAIACERKCRFPTPNYLDCPSNVAVMLRSRSATPRCGCEPPRCGEDRLRRSALSALRGRDSGHTTGSACRAGAAARWRRRRLRRRRCAPRQRRSSSGCRPSRRAGGSHRRAP